MAEELKPDHKVIGMNARPLWGNSNYRKTRSWYPLANDLIRFLDNNGFSNVIGVGHSFGSVITMIAATKDPDLFSKLVLIEPVILPKKVHMVVSLAPIPVLNALLRSSELQETERVMDGPKTAFAHFRVKPVFANISDEVLWDYVNSEQSQ